jgi:hypothetical protein
MQTQPMPQIRTRIPPAPWNGAGLLGSTNYRVLSGSVFPLSIDALDAKSHSRSGIGSLPAHAAFFHAQVDHEGDRTFHQAAPHWIASSLPQLVVAHPAFLGLEIPDGLLP